jgi:hypothetical protein
MEVPYSHIWQEKPANSSSQGDSRDAAGVEAVHPEEETTAMSTEYMFFLFPE